VHGLQQKVDVRDAASTPLGRTRLRLWGGHALYEGGHWELIAEAYRFENQDLAGGSAGRHRSWAAFGQVGREFGERWLPYYRYEKASFDPQDPYFATLASRGFTQRHVAGLRLAVQALAVLKLEWNRTRERTAGSREELRAQYAVGF
jgi:hypothetical protein